MGEDKVARGQSDKRTKWSEDEMTKAKDEMGEDEVNINLQKRLVKTRVNPFTSQYSLHFARSCLFRRAHTTNKWLHRITREIDLELLRF